MPEIVPTEPDVLTAEPATPEVATVEVETSPAPVDKPEVEDPSVVEARKKHNQRTERRFAIESIYDLVKMGQLDILDDLDRDKFGEIKLEEVGKFITDIDQRFTGEISAERQKEIVCTLAEIVADNHFTAGEMSALVQKIEYSPTAPAEIQSKLGYAPTAGYIFKKRKIIVCDAFFTCPEGGRNEILKHEIGHGVDTTTRKFSEIPEPVSKIIDAYLENGESSQSYHATKSLELLKSQQETLSPEDFEKNKKLAVAEIMAEKYGAFLESDGSFIDFVRASMEKGGKDLYLYLGVTPENQAEFEKNRNLLRSSLPKVRADAISEIMAICPNLKDFMTENSKFYKFIKENLVKVKEKIATTGEEETEDDFDEEWAVALEEFGGGIWEGGDFAGNVEQSAPAGQNKSAESFLSIAAGLAVAFAGEVAPKPTPADL
ncbi:MAG: hypothetical protein NTW79_02405 [Candidatus Berkelbacteria bacterium]|nr:hypothetical protein [Candidatus Berkelbacteria bacterium]